MKGHKKSEFAAGTCEPAIKNEAKQATTMNEKEQMSQRQVRIGDSVTWRGNCGVVVSSVPPNTQPSRLALVVSFMGRVSFNPNTVRSITSYLVVRKGPKGQTLYWPYNKSLQVA